MRRRRGGTKKKIGIFLSPPLPGTQRQPAGIPWLLPRETGCTEHCRGSHCSKLGYRMGAAQAVCSGGPHEYPVRVHVYELGGDMSGLLSVVGAGGVFHSGVEVDGVEYAFGDQSGVWMQFPGQLPPEFGANARYKGPENVGTALVTRHQLRSLVKAMKNEYPSSRYHLMTCNW